MSHQLVKDLANGPKSPASASAANSIKLLVELESYDAFRLLTVDEIEW